MKTGPLTPSEQLALHVLATARTLILLGGMSELEAIRLAVGHYRERSPASRRVMLNDEPIYVAGRVLGMSNQEVEDLWAELWGRYQAVLTSVYESPRELDFATKLPSVGGLEGQEAYSLRRVDLPPRPTPR